MKLSGTFGFRISLITKKRGIIPLWVEKTGGIYYSKGIQIVFSKGKAVDTYSVPKSLMESLFAWHSLIRRAMRMEISSLTVLNKTLIAVKRGAIITKSHDEKKFQITHQILRGSRPLNLCLFDDRVYWGEYFSNSEREEVHIFGTRDGIQWAPVYTFPSGTIRHVHGIYKDPIRNGMWVLTGDNDQESGLWYTKDYFKSLQCIVSGTQKARAVSIIPALRSLIVPMDSPKEINYIQRYDLENDAFVPLCQLAGSAFYRYSTPSLSLISTVVEPSSINTARFVELYASSDLENWIKVAQLKMDFWSKISMFIFRYPEIRFAEVADGDPDEIYLYCSGVSKYNNHTIILDRKKLISYLNENNSSVATEDVDN